MRVVRTKHPAWHHDQFLSDGTLGKLCASHSHALWNFYECIERTLRWSDIGHIRKSLDNHISPRDISLDDRGEIDMETFGCSCLERCRRTNKQILLQLGHLLNQGLRTRGISKSPPSTSITFSKATHQKHRRRKTRWTWAATIIERFWECECVIDFIRNQQNAAITTKFDNFQEFC